MFAHLLNGTQSQTFASNTLLLRQQVRKNKDISKVSFGQ
jgi:hypothetical protein